MIMKNKKPSVLIIYTGGTIGMIKDANTGELKSFNFKHIYKHVPELNRLNVLIESISFEQPIDSSEMTPNHWVQMAQMVFDNYSNYDGFVILHGSDTMAYGASALSFMLQGLRKPVIFTGSQLPIGTIRTDGKENLITAIEIAADIDNSGMAIVQEVAVYFEYSLYRGNRSSKISANQFEAFTSPNFSELAVAGVTIEYNLDKLFRTKLTELQFFPKLNTHVGLIKLYPGIPFKAYQNVFDINHTEALIIETYGSGNAPSDSTFRSLIENYINQGGIVLNITQCSSGSVHQGKYETSTYFNKVGVTSGGNMTSEAALAKLMHTLGNFENREERIQKLTSAICGEIG
jgi:L-asparaginase